MDSLKEIINALGQFSPENIRLIVKIRQPPTQTTQLYEGIKKGEFDSDEAAAKAILNCSAKHQSYKNLKTKFRSRLINTIFFINPKEFQINSEQNKISFGAYKQWTAAKILNNLGAKEAAVKLGKQVLKKAKKAGISHLVAEIAMFLRFYYGSIIGDRKQFEHYNELHHKHSEIMLWENKTQEYYTMLTLFYSEGKADPSIIYKDASSYYLEIKDALYQHKTYKLIFFGGFIKLVMYMNKGDYMGAINVCNEVLSLLDTNPLFPTLAKATFYTEQMVCCIQLRHFDKGEQLAKEAVKFLKPGLFNWFKYQELFFLLSMHTQKYQRAFEIVKETKGTKGFNTLDRKSKEIWTIYEMYTNYLILQNKIVAEKGRGIKVRLGKFLNEVPAYSQEKRGLNIPILIIQVLVYIQKKQYDKAIDRIGALEKYCSRHLRKENDFRSNCFIKMILELSKSGFHPVAATRKADRLFQKLKVHPVDIPNQSHSIEIIPYEVLWEVAIGSLDGKGVRYR